MIPASSPVTELDQINVPALVKLREWRPQAVQAARLHLHELTIMMDGASIREACRFLQQTPDLDFNFLSDLTCVDRYPLEPRFEVIYHLLSHRRKQRLRLKVKLAAADPSLESITPVWPAANFFEREIFDLFGVRFLGHPNLRRILMPDNWEGHPLRKDYPVEGFRS